MEADKVIDPGAEFSKPKPHTLEWILDFIRRHPGASTRTGEADLMVAEIDRLRKALIHEGCGGELIPAEYQCAKCNQFIGNP